MKDRVVYMLLCSDGSFYVGVTMDLDLRVEWHNEGADPFCYTFSRRPVQPVWSETFGGWDKALARERQVKGWSRAKKIALIHGDWSEIQKLSRVRGDRNPAR